MVEAQGRSTAPCPEITAIIAGVSGEALRDAVASVALQSGATWELQLAIEPDGAAAARGLALEMVGSGRGVVVSGTPRTPIGELLAAARGTHVLLLGPDRLLAPGFFSAALSALRARPGAPFAFSDEIDSGPLHEVVGCAALDERALTFGGLPPGAPLFRRECLEAPGNAELPLASLVDPALGPWRRWCRHVPGPVRLDEPLVLRRPVPGPASPYTVTAIVSAYKSTAFLQGCLEDLVSQTLYAKGKLEIVVVDTGSPEDEGAIVRRFQSAHEHVRYIRTPDRRTLYAAWNIGIRAARGQFVTNANADDRHRVDALEIMGRALERSPDVALVYADQLFTDVPNETFATTRSNLRRIWNEFSYPGLRAHCMVGPQPMWRRSVHERHGYFDEEFQSAGDYELWLRMGATERFSKIHDLLGLYYWNPKGIEHSNPRTGLETALARERYGVLPTEVGASGIAPYVQGWPMALGVKEGGGDSRTESPGAPGATAGDLPPVAPEPEAGSGVHVVPGAAQKVCILNEASEAGDDRPGEIETMNESCRSASNPSVSIVIAVRDGWESTFRCLMAVASCADDTSCETIVMDDASTDETRLGLPRLEGIVAARTETPVGRARALAAGAELARGRYLLFLDPRAEPRPGWLKPLVSALETDGSLAAVGPVLVDERGAVESAGLGMAYAAPLPITPFPLDHGKAATSVRGGEVAAISGACLLVRADAFREAGGLDQAYARGFEDLDLCFRLAQRGRLAIVAGSAVVLHGAPDWEDLGRHGEDISRLNRLWAGRFKAYTVDRRASGKTAPPRPGRPPLSVVVPTKDALASIASVVEDLALNLGPSDEIVISDCGSSDGTVEYAKAFERDHPGMARVVESEAAAGLAGAARAGLAAARRPTAALVHTAMSLAPGFLDDATELLARNPGASALAVPMNGAGVYTTGATAVLRDVADSSPQAFFAHGADELASRFAERAARMLVVVPDAPPPHAAPTSRP